MTPLRPDKIFGLIFFQCKYDKVSKRRDEQLRSEYDKIKFRHLVNLKLKTPEYKIMRKPDWDRLCEERIIPAFELEHKEATMKELEANMKSV